MFYVYAIKSERDGRIYVGMCSEVKARLKEHNAGKTKSTKGYTPGKLIYFKEKPNRIEARKREK